MAADIQSNGGGGYGHFSAWYLPFFVLLVAIVAIVAIVA